jgi:hypothetical protein
MRIVFVAELCVENDRNPRLWLLMAGSYNILLVADFYRTSIGAIVFEVKDLVRFIVLPVNEIKGFLISNHPPMRLVNEYSRFRISFMDSIPLQLQAEFEAILRNKAVPTGLHPLYKKWLHFNLDFCRKYHFSEKERKSLEHFLWKLQVKKQAEEQQQQASHAIHFLL